MSDSIGDFVDPVEANPDKYIMMCRQAAASGQERCVMEDGEVRALVTGATRNSSVGEVRVALWDIKSNKPLCFARFVSGQLKSYRIMTPSKSRVEPARPIAANGSASPKS